MATHSTPATHEEITRLAFQIWCENGRRPDTAEQNWHAAERQLQREQEHQVLTDNHIAEDARD